MDEYTRKFFFEEIEKILDAQPIEKIRPVLVYHDIDGIVTALHWSGNKIIGDIEDICVAEIGIYGQE